jgi:hypothetical protein
MSAAESACDAIIEKYTLDVIVKLIYIIGKNVIYKLQTG